MGPLEVVFINSAMVRRKGEENRSTDRLKRISKTLFRGFLFTGQLLSSLSFVNSKLMFSELVKRFLLFKVYGRNGEGYLF